jgi:hypothetical protein
MIIALLEAPGLIQKSASPPISSASPVHPRTAEVPVSRGLQIRPKPHSLSQSQSVVITRDEKIDEVNT